LATRAIVAIDVTSSSVNEHVSYPDLLDKTISAIGDKPRAVVGDRGFSIGAVFERNTREGIASVFPYRKFGQIDRADLDTERYDRYGVPRCQHCGGESMFVRFNAEPSPRMWFECSDQTTPECAREQTISCSHNWRLLLPLWRTSEAYWALKESHGEYERVHHLWRGRYRVGGDTHISRPKRISIGWQQLRANAAILIEWLRVLDRQGSLGSVRRNPNTDRRRDVPRAYARFLRLREWFRPNLPYGLRAEALGLTGRPPHLPGAGPPGDDTPPF
jgi:hypothetical protein